MLNDEIKREQASWKLACERGDTSAMLKCAARIERMRIMAASLKRTTSITGKIHLSDIRGGVL